MRYRFEAIPERTNNLNSAGQLMAHGYDAAAYCENAECRHKDLINLVALAKTVGLHTSVFHDDLQQIFYCAPCRAAGRPDRRASAQVGPVPAVP